MVLTAAVLITVLIATTRKRCRKSRDISKIGDENKPTNNSVDNTNESEYADSSSYEENQECKSALLNTRNQDNYTSVRFCQDDLIIPSNSDSYQFVARADTTVSKPNKKQVTYQSDFNSLREEQKALNSLEGKSDLHQGKFIFMISIKIKSYFVIIV